MENNELLEELLNSYETDNYPDGFESKFSIMECLSDRNGVCTFLVQDKNEIVYIAKCYEKNRWDITDKGIQKTLDHPGIPRFVDFFENSEMSIIVREYIDGTDLLEYINTNDPDQNEIIDICIKICDILSYLHHREPPVIHRDIKPQNIIMRQDGSLALIDFDIARIYQNDKDYDTSFFGTVSYSPPEQYGFSQTDVRSDIYSFGVLLRHLITGSPKENKNIKIYKPLQKIIDKATGFAPEKRFSDISQVKKALLNATPKKQKIKAGIIIFCSLVLAGALVFAGIKIYQKITYNPFVEGDAPAYLSDDQKVADAVEYMKNKYHTDMFDASGDVSTVGDLRKAMIELYGLDKKYVYGINKEMPQESDEYFLPWGWDDGQTVDRDIMIYAAVKVHDPSIVADWSEIKDDNGFYPGVRAAVAYAEKNGIADGANRPGDISLGEMALILANADNAFETS